MPEKALKNIAAKHHLTADQAAEILRLLEGGYGAPYVMRYRKELAAGMDAEGLHELLEEKRRLEKLDARRHKILKKLQEREILTPELQERIERAADMRELIDYYVPFRPRKRSRSRQALAQGLEPLARAVLSQEEFIPEMSLAAEPYVNPDKGLDSVEAVLEGTFHIVADWVAEEKAHRDRQREVFRQEADLVASRAGRSLPSRLAREFRSYLDFRQKACKVHPYHMLAILRGKRLKVLDYRLEAPLAAMSRAAAELYLPGGAAQLEKIETEFGSGLPSDDGARLRGLNGTEFLTACIRHSLASVLVDVTFREMDKDLCAAAENLALEIIRRSVRSLLMAKPLPVRVLGIHPGYRTGCNLAVVDEKGSLLALTTVYPHAPQNDLDRARAEISRLVQEHGVQAVVIGNATAAQETEALIAEIIAETHPELRYAVIAEVGTEALAEGRAARNELPDAKPGERCAVSLCRRLQDPLSELTKVNARELCPAPYGDDVNGGALKKLLDRTLEQCVSEVGADANTAYSSMLRYVCGLGPERALELVEYRQKHAPLGSRQQLREVPKLDEATFERAAGFIRVAFSGNPLDVTRIHPRLYPAAEAICQQVGVALSDLATDQGREQVRQRCSEVKLADLEKQFGVHYLLLKDIVSELHTPWPDPRQDGQAPVLRQRRLTIEELQAGQWFEGAVRNIVDFGVFVDIGVGEDGLVHISELSDRFVESPYDVVSVGDSVRVRVVGVDQEKRRIRLSMRDDTGRKERPVRAPRPGRPRERVVAEARPAEARVPADRPSSAVRMPRSTVGWHSRRVEKAALAAQAAKAREQAAAAGQPQATQPVPERPQEQGKQAEEPKASIGSLIARLGFADVERRGKPTD